MLFQFTVADVKKLREETGLGMLSCRRILKGREMRTMLQLHHGSNPEMLAMVLTEIVTALYLAEDPEQHQ